MDRDKSLDILRAIALLGMMVAHCDPHPIIMQLREFDVPLIVFLSGVSFYISENKGNKLSYLSYCWKRIKRLVFPAWIFLCIYYFVLYTGLSITGNLIVNPNEIIHNFTFMTGWYVWIIRVFLIIALLAPPVYAVTKKMNVTLFLLCFFIILVCYEFIAKTLYADRYYYLTMTIPYILVFALGTISKKMGKSHFIIMAIISMAIYIGMAIQYYNLTGSYQITEICKYPPRMYYISYALVVISVLWSLKERISSFFERIRLSPFLIFVGSHTLWIYFWHIIALLLFENRINSSGFLFIVISLIAFVMVQIQIILINKIINKSNNVNLNKTLSLLFLG